jgi:thiamine biosynthesis lipoprotein
MKKKDRIFIEILVGLSLITAAVYFFVGVGVEKESIWPAGRVDVDSGGRAVMGTFARVIAVAADSNTAKRCIEAAFAEITTVDRLMSRYRNDSQISQMNRDGFRRAVVVSKSTFEVLQRAVGFSELTYGAFDVTVGPLVDLWHSTQDTDSVPTDAQLQQARSKVGYDKLILDASENTVRFAVDGMSLDLGGIAKGYAIDKAVDAAQKAGALGAMVEIGGDIRCFGLPPQGRNGWRIGLQSSKAITESVGTDEVLLVLELTDAAVATSGDYRRFVLIEGKRHSHILDTRTGRASEGLTSVTIISPNAADADALATAVSVMGSEKGLALIEAEPDTEAILVSPAPQYELIKSTGAEKFIK